MAQRILGYLPAPQTTAATNNFVYNSPSDQDARSWDVRVDQIVSQRQNLDVRASYQRTDDKYSSPLPPDGQGNYVSGGDGQVSINRSVAFVHNAVWTPNVLSADRVGWNHINWDNTMPDQALQGVGIPGVDNSHPGCSQIAIAGYRSLGISNVPNADDSRNLQLPGDVTGSRGNHTIKTGVQACWLGIDFLSSQRSSGIFNFNGQYTGDAFADFLLGYSSSASLSQYAKLNFRAPYTHFFAQDDWRLSRRLTLNLGLRYELSPPPIDVNNGIANFNLDTNPTSPNDRTGWRGRERPRIAGAAGRQLPAAGAAGGRGLSAPGRPDGRARWAGVFYSNMIAVGGMSSLEINPPNLLRISGTTDRTVPSIFLSQGFPEGSLVPASATDVNLVRTIGATRSRRRISDNVNVQRELPGGVLAEVGFHSNRFVNNWRSIDGNPAPAAAGHINSRHNRTAVVPTTGDVISLANITRIQKDGWSQYRALQTKVEKRYAKGISLLASYTYSRTVGLEGGYQDSNNIAAEIGPHLE